MKSDSIIYPVIDADTWARRYSISVSSDTCRKYDKVLYPTIPFATGGWRGLMSEPHGCDEAYDLSVAVPVSRTERQKLIDYFYILQDNLSPSPQ